MGRKDIRSPENKKRKEEKKQKMNAKNELFSAVFDSKANCVTLSLCGEIDHHSAFAVRREIDDMLCTLRPERLVIDLGEVEFMDSSGLGLIMGRYTVMQGLGGRTILRTPNERVLKMLKLAGIDKIIGIEKTKNVKKHPKNERTGS